MDCEDKLQEPLDRMWLALIMEAKQCGITLEQIKAFIKNDSGGEMSHHLR